MLGAFSLVGLCFAVFRASSSKLAAWFGLGRVRLPCPWIDGGIFRAVLPGCNPRCTRPGPSQRRSCLGRLSGGPGRFEPERIEAHTLRARAWPASLRRKAGGPDWPLRAGAHRGAHVLRARADSLATVAHDRAGSWPSSQRRSCPGRLNGGPGQLQPDCIEPHTFRARVWPASLRRNAGGPDWPLRAGAHRGAHVLRARADLAGGHRARPGQVLAILSAPVLPWAIERRAWPLRAGTHRGAHASSAGLAGQLAPQRRWTGLATSSRSASRRTRASSAAAVAHDRAGSWPSSQRRSCPGRLNGGPGQLQPDCIEAHTLRARAWPASLRRNAGGPDWPLRAGAHRGAHVLRARRPSRTTEPGPGHPLSAGPALAD